MRFSLNRRHGMLLALMVGVFLSPINVNFSSVALPTMRDSLEISVELATWISTAYFIPTVIFMPLATYLAQRFGTKRVYLIGMAMVGVGSFGSALSNDFVWLMIWRIVQGAGWSALYPIALILIRSHYPEERQGSVMGIWESAVGVATIIGPFIGGQLVARFDWHAVFWAMGGIAALGALLSWVSIPEDEGRYLGGFDWSGAMTLTGALLLLLLGATLRHPLLLLAGISMGFLWWWLARQNEKPFVPPELMQNVRFVSAALAAMIRLVVGVGCLLALPLFLEDVLDFDPARVGLVLPIYSLFLLIGTQPGGRWADKAGGRTPSVVGSVLTAVGVGGLILLDVQIGLLYLGVVLAIRGLGAGLSQAPFAQVATGAAPPEQRSVAAGLYGAIRYSGLALGSALVGVFLEARFAAMGISGTGEAAVPAYQELFLVLTVFALAGVLFSWTMGSEQKARERQMEMEARV